jgi:hypothetical protein
VRILLKEFIDDVSRLILLLYEAEDLIDLIRDDISVLVLLIFLGSLFLSVLRIVFLVLL